MPVIILNLSPEESIDYDSFNKLNDRTLMTGKWLEYCSACPVPEIVNVFQRIGINFYQVTGYLKENYVWKEIGEWIGKEDHVTQQSGFNGVLLQWNVGYLH